ncbi:MAG: PIG-L deacetylase family protein [bacterium]|nr:PIG-L deacetylase family protein [bacterium]
MIMQLCRGVIRRCGARVAFRRMVRVWMRIRDLDTLARVLATQRFSEQRAPVVHVGPDANRILVLAPHPDDESIGCGGALLLARRRNAVVHIVHVTCGEADPESVEARMRAEEAQGVVAVLGATCVAWEYPTRAIPPAAAERIREAIVSFRPDVVFLPFFVDDHPDHRRVAELFALAYADTSPLTTEVWAYQVYSAVLPNVIVDITEVMDAKEQLVRRFTSQQETRDWAHYVRGMNAWNSRFLRTRDPRYAEQYCVMPATEYVQLCGEYFPRVAAR